MAEGTKGLISCEVTDDHVRVRFSRSARVFSSAVLGGGMCVTDQVVNVRVGENFPGKRTDFPDPAKAIAIYCRERGWKDDAVGMMTAASMQSFRASRMEDSGAQVVALVTSGLSNALRAGDPAGCRGRGPDGCTCNGADEATLDGCGYTPGTINIIMVTSATLDPAAHVECIQMITEAKTAVLQDLGVVSGATGRTATGTGTDAVAAVSLGAGPRVRYAGKHVPFGEMVACSVIEALAASLHWYGGTPCAF